MPRQAKPVPLMTTAEAAVHLKISKSKLEKMRSEKTRGGSAGPPVVEIGRSRRYRPADLDEWAANQVVGSTGRRRPGGRT